MTSTLHLPENTSTDTRTAPCSDATRTAGDDPTGSAAAFETFLLLDYRRPWGHDAAGDAVRDVLDAPAALAAHQAKPLRAFAIRPTGNRRAPIAARAYAGRVGHRALLTALTTLPDEQAVTEIAAGTPPGAPTDAVLVGVCTNAKRDRCCAVRGRPVAAALRQQFGERITEISHLGGHRFAATMLVLPTGYAYGFLDSAAAHDVVAAAIDGLVHPAHLRGRADLTPPAQAADAHWRGIVGAAPVDDVRITGVQTDGDEALVDAIVQGTPDRLAVTRVPCPAIHVTACGGKPIATGHWEVHARRGDLTRR